LDFDMAFTRQTFNKITSNGQRDDAMYDEWLKMEQNALKTALAGDENLNSGASGVVHLDENMTILKWALRDTMVTGFLSAFDQKEDIHPMDSKMNIAIHALLKLALILTEKQIA